MTVVKRRQNGNFTVIPNRLLEDQRLSIEAKGLQCWLLARPHDWSFKLALIGPSLGIGRDKTERLFRELIDAGYIDRIQERMDGRWGQVEYVVFDDPRNTASPTIADDSAHIDHQDTASSPHPEKPVPEKPVPESQGAYIKLKETKTERNKRNVADECAREPLIGKAALDLTEQLLVIAGHDPNFWPPGWCGAPMRVQTWLSTGWPPEIIIAVTRAVAARKTGPPAASVQFFEKAIAEEIARQNRPVPEIRDVQTASDQYPVHRPQKGNAYARIAATLGQSARD